MQAEGDDSPFRILHNYRKPLPDRNRPKRKISACERLQHVPEFTMRTRKMTAEIELRLESSTGMAANNEEALSDRPAEHFKLEEPEEFLLREEELEKAIPLDRQLQNEPLFDLEENSHASNYSKLEKALFGFSMHDEMEEEPQSQREELDL